MENLRDKNKQIPIDSINNNTKYTDDFYEVEFITSPENRATNPIDYSSSQRELELRNNFTLSSLHPKSHTKEMTNSFEDLSKFTLNTEYYLNSAQHKVIDKNTNKNFSMSNSNFITPTKCEKNLEFNGLPDESENQTHSAKFGQADEGNKTAMELSRILSSQLRHKDFLNLQNCGFSTDFSYSYRNENTEPYQQINPLSNFNLLSLSKTKSNDSKLNKKEKTFYVTDKPSFSNDNNYTSFTNTEPSNSKLKRFSADLNSTNFKNSYLKAKKEQKELQTEINQTKLKILNKITTDNDNVFNNKEIEYRQESINTSTYYQTNKSSKIKIDGFICKLNTEYKQTLKNYRNKSQTDLEEKKKEIMLERIKRKDGQLTQKQKLVDKKTREFNQKMNEKLLYQDLKDLENEELMKKKKLSSSYVKMEEDELIKQRASSISKKIMESKKNYSFKLKKEEKKTNEMLAQLESLKNNNFNVSKYEKAKKKICPYSIGNISIGNSSLSVYNSCIIPKKNNNRKGSGETLSFLDSKISNYDNKEVKKIDYKLKNNRNDRTNNNYTNQSNINTSISNSNHEGNMFSQHNLTDINCHKSVKNMKQTINGMKINNKKKNLFLLNSSKNTIKLSYNHKSLVEDMKDEENILELQKFEKVLKFSLLETNENCQILDSSDHERKLGIFSKKNSNTDTKTTAVRSIFTKKPITSLNLDNKKVKKPDIKKRINDLSKGNISKDISNSSVKNSDKKVFIFSK